MYILTTLTGTYRILRPIEFCQSGIEKTLLRGLRNQLEGRNFAGGHVVRVTQIKWYDPPRTMTNLTPEAAAISFGYEIMLLVYSKGEIINGANKVIKHSSGGLYVTLPVGSGRTYVYLGIPENVGFARPVIEDGNTEFSMIVTDDDSQVMYPPMRSDIIVKGNLYIPALNQDLPDLKVHLVGSDDANEFGTTVLKAYSRELKLGDEETTLSRVIEGLSKELSILEADMESWSHNSVDLDEFKEILLLDIDNIREILEAATDVAEGSGKFNGKTVNFDHKHTLLSITNANSSNDDNGKNKKLEKIGKLEKLDSEETDDYSNEIIPSMRAGEFMIRIAYHALQRVRMVTKTDPSKITDAMIMNYKHSFSIDNDGDE